MKPWRRLGPEKLVSKVLFKSITLLWVENTDKDSFIEGEG